MPSVAIVDASVIVAAVNQLDRDHRRCIPVLSDPRLRLVFPALVVTEACYMIQRELGAQSEARFVRTLAAETVDAPDAGEWERMAALMEQYADLPLGAADASVIALAERYRTDTIVTLDRRHFGTVRPAHVAAFRLLPD